jgi:hypothetical protein
MADNHRSASLTVTMVDELSRPARAIEAALRDSEARVKELSAAMSEAGGSDRLVQSLNKLGASKADVEAVARSFQDYTRAAGLAGDASSWTKEAAAGVRAWEASTINSVKAVIRERRAESDAMRNIANRIKSFSGRRTNRRTFGRRRSRAPAASQAA